MSYIININIKAKKKEGSYLERLYALIAQSQ